MTEVTAQARHKQSRETALEEMSLLFRRLRKVDREDADVTCCGRPFHTCATATGKLCRRWLTDAYDGRPVMKMALNEGDVVG